MKKSNYNIIFENDGKKFAFNSMSCALAEVDHDFFYILNNLNNDNIISQYKGLVETMKEGNYIVDDSIDEIKKLKMRNYYGKFSDKTLSLTILPNLSCNFACPYCYEGKIQNKSMENIRDDVIEAIYKQVERSSALRRNITVAWYGGEPTLSKDIIIKMSEKIIMICENHGVEYKSSITSNGYLIDDDFIKNMKKFKISTAHITLDGPPNFHNKTRKLKNGQGTFGVIIENIKKLINSGIKVFIRVNVTKFNMNCFEELLDVLDKNNLNNITITPSAVVSYKNTNTDITNTCLSAEEFSKKLLEYCKLMSTRKFSAANYPYSFSIKTNYCFADNISSYTIDYNGNIYKCWVDVGTPNCSLGNIRDFLERDLLTAAENDSKYIFWSAFKHKKCMECKVLPICMGGCPSRGIINNNKPYCELAKYCLEDALKTQLS